MPSENYSRILIFQTAFLGDLFLSVPLLKALRSEFPQSKLGLVCRKNFGEFFLETHLVDQVFEVDKKSSKSLKHNFSETRKFKADLIISTHRSFRTALWVRRLNVKESVGFHEPWNFWAYPKRVFRDSKKHDVLRQLSLLEPLGFNPDAASTDVLHPRIEISENPKFLSLKNSVALAPGSQWETKRWPVEGFVEIARKFISEGKKVILVGGIEEKPISKIMTAQIPEIENLVGKTTVFELAQLLSQCRLLVTNDSGAMHVATTVGLPVVGIFGPTVPAQGYAPWSKKSEIVEKLNLACRPCGAHGHNKCPIGTHECMKSLSSEKVLQATSRVLG